jgi:hypothetical protein
VCEELTRRFKTRVSPDARLAEQRVVWAFLADVSLPDTLARLAELVGGRVVERETEDGRRRFILERTPETVGREREWRRSALLRTLNELKRAADEHERGNLDTVRYSANVRTYLEFGRAPELKYLRRLTPQQMDRLLQGEVISFGPGAVPEAEVEQIIVQRYPLGRNPDETPESIEMYREEERRRARQHGLGLGIDFERKGRLFYLMLHVGGRPGNVLCGFGDEELGLPLTPLNPYRLLAESGKPLPRLEPPAFLRRPLAADVMLPEDGRWESALQALARAAGIDVVSDAYLCRALSKVQPAPNEKEVLLARRGTTPAEALETLCRRHEYRWWEKDGVVYLRARLWPWEGDYEVPDRFLDAWSLALKRHGRVGPSELSELGRLTPLQWNGLENLAATRFLPQVGLYQSEPRQLARLFLNSKPPAQAQLLGPGLLLPADQAAAYDSLLRPLATEVPPHPQLLQLAQRVRVDSTVTPPVTLVEFALLSTWQQHRRTIDFAVPIPSLQPPFLP